MWHDIISILQNNQKFVITSHVNPDCDALGSELALAELLCEQGKQVSIINSDPVPAAYKFLDPRRRISRFSPKKHLAIINEAQVICVLDASGSWQRTGPVGDVLKQAQAIKICIDHHPDPADFVDLAVIDTGVSATGELIFDLLQTMGGTLSPAMAETLYAAILTDSGSFRFPNTSPQTHLITAELLRAGANPLHIYQQIYQQYSINRIRLKGYLMNTIQTEVDGQLAHYRLDLKTLKSYGVDTDELDGFASLGQEIGGVRVVIFGLQTSKSKVKISFRSDGSFVVNQLAAAYGGGGHPSAAGASIPGQLDEVMAEIIAKTKALLEDSNSQIV